MKKKLPGIFACKVSSSGNNKEVFYGGKKDITIEKPNIYAKINKIFSSSDYIYKADVVISLKDGKIKRNIIGKNKDNLITMDNELIPINNIIDIEKSK